MLKKWQFIYLGIVAVAFLIGWTTRPIFAVAFTWVSILSAEALNYRREIKDFRQRSEET